MVSENELFRFEVQKLWLFEDDSNGFFVQLLSLLIEMLNDFEVNLLMLQE
jgi:hypothetical protein